jgi:hypothetical protein
VKEGEKRINREVFVWDKRNFTESHLHVRVQGPSVRMHIRGDVRRTEKATEACRCYVSSIFER